MAILKILVFNIVLTVISIIFAVRSIPLELVSREELFRKTSAHNKLLEKYMSTLIPIWLDIVIDVVLWPVLIVMYTIEVMLRADEYRKAHEEGAA